MDKYGQLKNEWSSFCGTLDLNYVTTGSTQNRIEWEGGRMFSGDAHFRLYFPTRGKFNLLYSAEAYPIVPGFRYIIPPVIPFRFEGIEPSDHGWIHFHSSKLEKLYRFIRPAAIPVNAAEDFALFRKFYDLITRSSSIYEAEEVRHELTKLILPFIERMKNAPETLATNANFPRILEYIDEHLSQEIRIGELEKLAGLRRAEFSARFRKIYAIPPKQYISLRRISRAKYLLTRTDLAIKEIVWKTGFESEIFFFRVFKKYTGTTPLRFRLASRIKENLK